MARRARPFGQVSRRSVIVALALSTLVAIGASAAAGTFSSGVARPFAMGALYFLVMAPFAVLITKTNSRQRARSDDVVSALVDQLGEALRSADQNARMRDAEALRQRNESRLANALDMAEGEPEVIDVIERSLTMILPDNPSELLLADHSHAHLRRMAFASSTGEPPGCGVESPDRCPAARRAQAQRFEDSDALDSCPKLRGRSTGRISALCVPVSIMGRTVGVIHATGEPCVTATPEQVREVSALANLAGSRIGLLRVMADTQLQAATDNLTGLLNRRTFEHEFSELRSQTDFLAVAIGDFDHFKALNDTYGHETGDRALRLFAQTLMASHRSGDLVCRYGGEEFVLALPACSANEAREVLDALRVRLDAAITVAGLPKYTVSFGVVETRPEEDLPSAVRRADTALYQAKQDGRDRIVVHDAYGRPVAPPSLVEQHSRALTSGEL